MKNSVQIRVNKPCSENFNEFEKTAKGGFCNSCQKEVIDFSQMSNSEVLSFFSLKTKDVCGRFRSSQVQNPISNLLKKGIGIASISLMALAISPPLQAQNTTAKVEVIAQQQYVVKGIVSDDQNYPLPGVNVVLKGSKEGVVTDLDGKFEFSRPLAKDDVLVFSYIGFEPKEFKITDSKTEIIDVTINFEVSDVILMGEVYIDEVYTSKGKKTKKFTSIFKK